MENNKQGRVQHDFVVGEKASSPLAQGFTSLPKLVVEVLARLNVWGRHTPSFKDRIMETREASPKVFKLEAARPSRATIIGEEKRAMVR
jgi:hypothetical protein